MCRTPGGHKIHQLASETRATEAIVRRSWRFTSAQQSVIKDVMGGNGQCDECDDIQPLRSQKPLFEAKNGDNARAALLYTASPPAAAILHKSFGTSSLELDHSLYVALGGAFSGKLKLASSRICLNVDFFCVVPFLW